MTRALWIAAALGALAGCYPELETCTPEELEAARALVYRADATGLPAYEGQALVHQGCAGGGAFCHSSAAEGDARHGAPSGLDFDLPVTTAGDDRAAALRIGQQNVYGWRHAIVGAVELEQMPPGDAGRAIAADGVYAHADGSPLPPLDQPRGQAILRNWLSCGSPVVERTEGEGDVGDTVSARGSGPANDWDSLHAAVFAPTCAVSNCHVGGADAAGGLDLTDVDAAHARLVGGASADFGDCAGRTYVVPGDPGASLLYQKLTGAACGERMPLDQPPLPEATLADVRAWIEAGAPRR